MCQYKKEEAKHKAISVVKPVGALEAVPYKVGRAHAEAEYEEKNETACKYLFLCRKLL